jgi:hypothetical protein
MTPPLNLDAVFLAVAAPGTSPKDATVPDFAALVEAANATGAAMPVLPELTVETANKPAPHVLELPADETAVVKAAVPALELKAASGAEKITPVASDCTKTQPTFELFDRAVLRLAQTTKVSVTPVPALETSSAETPPRPAKGDVAAKEEEDEVEAPLTVVKIGDEITAEVGSAVVPVVPDLQFKPMKERRKAAIETPAPLAARVEIRAEATPALLQLSKPVERRPARRDAEPVFEVPGALGTGPRTPEISHAAASATTAGLLAANRSQSDFTHEMMHLARDIVSASAEQDVQFNVRPAFLGPVSVTIERGDEGPLLRLGVETQAAALAVKQAEPTLITSTSPFVQVSVDLNSPGQRERSARAAAFLKRGRDVVPDPTIEQATAKTGRFA